jgi:hypothetical protein
LAEGATSSAPKAPIISPNILDDCHAAGIILEWRGPLLPTLAKCSVRSNATIRLAERFCLWRSCDRGHRYCSPACRADVRRQQRRARSCQRPYRERADQVVLIDPVTDQGVPLISVAPPVLGSSGACRCNRGHCVTPVPAFSGPVILNRTPASRWAIPGTRCATSGSFAVSPTASVYRSTDAGPNTLSEGQAGADLCSMTSALPFKGKGELLRWKRGVKGRIFSSGAFVLPGGKRRGCSGRLGTGRRNRLPGTARRAHLATQESPNRACPKR